MDGHFQNKDHEYEKVIKSWMLSIVRDGGLTRYDDLHIDRIDDEWKSTRFWIPAALHAYNLAVIVRNRAKISFPIVVAFSLKPSDRHVGVDFSTREQFEARLSRTPPSLYLFEAEREPWAQSRVAGSPARDLIVEHVNPLIFSEFSGLNECWSIEFKHEDVEGYGRSVFVTEPRL